jgi:quinoprotein glucose dehydrogenase
MRLPHLAVVLACVVQLQAAAGRDWPAYLGDKAASHYSTLTEITPANVGQIEVAWTYHAGETRPDTSQIQCNPLVIDGVMYATTPGLQLVAVDAATGRELWRTAVQAPNGVNRGLAWWADGDDRRILFGNGHWLYAINARTGEVIPSFGDNGRVDLSADLGRDVTGLAIQANTPGVVYRDLIIMGMRLGEGPAQAAPGHIRAYNIRTGKLAWIFHTIPWPGEPGYETWPPDAWQRTGGANVWTGMTVDDQRGLVFCPIGSATFDFWGGDRVGDNLYANSLVALDAATGQRVWHYQLTRHDLWDRDPPAPPALVTVRRDGREIPAVAQVTKSGHVWVFNRETGESLFPVEEIAVPSSDLAGEVAAPTQRLPLKPAAFARQLFTADEITNRTPEAHRAVLNQFVRLRPHVAFGPPSREGTIIFPGYDGGAEWGGAAVDPDGVMYVNSNEMAWILAMVETTGAKTPGEQVFIMNCAGCHGIDRKGNAAANIPSLVDLGKRLTHAEAMEVVTNGRRVMPSWSFLPADRREAVVSYLRDEPLPAAETGHSAPAWPTYMNDNRAAVTPPPFTHTGYNRFLDPEGYPAIKPPWGTLNAINLNTGEYLWRIPFGEYPELMAKGLPPTGRENYGGPLVTAGGVLFIGATKDEYFRAYDRATGRELWRTKLPAGGYATPSTYEVNGRQYVVIACGGGKGTPSGDAYVAFALPKKP